MWQDTNFRLYSPRVMASYSLEKCWREKKFSGTQQKCWESKFSPTRNSGRGGYHNKGNDMNVNDDWEEFGKLAVGPAVEKVAQLLSLLSACNKCEIFSLRHSTLIFLSGWTGFAGVVVWLLTRDFTWHMNESWQRWLWEKEKKIFLFSFFTIFLIDGKRPVRPVRLAEIYLRPSTWQSHLVAVYLTQQIHNNTQSTKLLLLLRGNDRNKHYSSKGNLFPYRNTKNLRNWAIWVAVDFNWSSKTANFVVGTDEYVHLLKGRVRKTKKKPDVVHWTLLFSFHPTSWVTLRWSWHGYTYATLVRLELLSLAAFDSVCCCAQLLFFSLGGSVASKSFCNCAVAVAIPFPRHG